MVNALNFFSKLNSKVNYKIEILDIFLYLLSVNGFHFKTYPLLCRIEVSGGFILSSNLNLCLIDNYYFHLPNTIP